MSQSSNQSAMSFPTIDSYTLLWLEWSIGSLLVCISGLLVLNYSDLLPNFVHRTVKYGKSAEAHGKPKKFRFLELPKRYFFHFYSVALVFYIVLAALAMNIYFNINLFGDPTQLSPTFLEGLLDFFVNHNYFMNSYQRVASVSPESVMIGLLLLIVQVARRLCECKMVSVYSDAPMNIIHYIFGHSFYIGVGLSMLAEAPGFTGKATLRFNPSKYEFVTPCHMIGIILFLWSSYIQFDSHRILANLRKDTTGRIITTKHSIPEGKWFNLVSSPHYMAEIMIYLAITIVLGGRSSTWWMVFLFVVTNQIIVGMFNHSWYLKRFPKEYPKSRRAIIPYVL